MLELISCSTVTRRSLIGSRVDSVHLTRRVLLVGPGGHRHRSGRLGQSIKGRAGRFGTACASGPGWETEDFYPDLVDKASVLTCRLAWNHPLPDGNKRAAWAALVVFVDLNGGKLDPDPPNVDEAEAAMLAVAAHEWDEAQFADWLRQRTAFD